MGGGRVKGGRIEIKKPAKLIFGGPELGMGQCLTAPGSPQTLREARGTPTPSYNVVPSTLNVLSHGVAHRV